MNNCIPEIYRLIQDISWYFGNQGFDGECCDGLSLVEYMALKKAYDTQYVSMQELGVMLNISKSGISKVIDRLEARSYIKREQSASDGRVCCVLPTEEGVDALTRIAGRYSDYLQETLSAMEPQSLQRMEKSLRLLLEAIQQKGFIK
ncbi:MAG: MarR family winged helix-turn-helix transcriptional regulator [Bacillota bacterium]|nr:MarR family winged helix-turn-helix transcriptional regulator [Bacillota bacterium]MDW7676787.1 MarR family winged helix-turn-helix transcriptional regulator [Bacillota bacterium]